MKTKPVSQSASISPRLLIGLLISLAGASFGLIVLANQSNDSSPEDFLRGGRDSASTQGALGPFPVIQLQQVASGLISPVAVANAGDGTARLFIVEQEGLIRILIGGTVLPTPFLNISGLVSCCGEQGLRITLTCRRNQYDS